MFVEKRNQDEFLSDTSRKRSKADSYLAFTIVESFSNVVRLIYVPEKIWFEKILPILKTNDVMRLYSTCKFFYDSKSLSRRFGALRAENDRDFGTHPFDYGKSSESKRVEGFEWKNGPRGGDFLKRIYEADSVELFHLYLFSKRRNSSDYPIPLFCRPILDHNAFRIFEAILSNKILKTEAKIHRGAIMQCAISADSAELYDLCRNYPKEMKAVWSLETIKEVILIGSINCLRKILNDWIESDGNKFYMVRQLEYMAKQLKHVKGTLRGSNNSVDVIFLCLKEAIEKIKSTI